jgi:D-alanyl-D-alanine carboxypeptidase
MKQRFFSHTTLSVAGSIMLGCALFAGYIFFVIPAPQARVATFPAALSLDPATLTARSAILYDPATGAVLFEKDADTPRPLASLTKLMAATIVLNNAGTLERPVTLTKQQLVPEGDAGDWNFKAGDTANLGDLVKFGLVASSNDAMAAAAASLDGNYLADMNAAAAALGLEHTYFLNPTGLDLSANTSGAYGSAADVAKLASSFLKKHPQFFELTATPVVSIKASGRTLVADATAAPLLAIPGFIGAKTGYTDLAGGNLVAAFDLDIGHPVIAVVLGSTEEGRFTDIKMLIDAARAQQQHS